MPRRLALWALVALLGALGACRQRLALDGRDARPTLPPAGGGGQVALTARDLAEVDLFLSARNAQWILGDDVEVVASREYFAQNLTVNRSTGLVERADETRPDATVVRLRYVGDPGAASVVTNPRLLLGTGLTVSARRTLTLRLVRTTDAARPVHLLVRAVGDAAQGRKEQVERRAPELRLGGDLLPGPGGWRWVPVR
jgi:hypothetical protein